MKKNKNYNTSEYVKEYVCRVFRNARQKVIFASIVQEKKLCDALRKLGISYTVADMPYDSTLGGVRYKHTLTVKDCEKLQSIIDAKIREKI